MIGTVCIAAAVLGLCAQVRRSLALADAPLLAQQGEGA